MKVKRLFVIAIGIDETGHYHAQADSSIDRKTMIEHGSTIKQVMANVSKKIRKKHNADLLNPPPEPGKIITLDKPRTPAIIVPP